MTQFDFELIDDVLVIYDLDRDGQSICHDIQPVLNRIGGELGRMGRRVIYRDPYKVFDGIRLENGRFVGFYSIGETVLEKALQKVMGVYSMH